MLSRSPAPSAAALLALAASAAITAAPGTAAASPPRFGLMADAGLPDGATASLVVRPWSFLRLSGGAGYNGISRGLRAGVTLAPLPFWLTPTLSIDYGRYPEGDANPLARRLTGDPEFSSELLERVGYSYANAHAGLAFGRQRVTFFVQAGATRVTGNVHNLNAVAGGEMSSVTFHDDPRITMWSISARLGLVVYFLR